MKRIYPHSIGLVFAVFLAAWHILWSLLVAAGAGQPAIDFIFRLHMIAPPYKIAAFNLGTAARLALVTAGIGYMGARAAGLIWNLCIPNNVKVQMVKSPCLI